MTHRERMLRAIRGEWPDRIPFAPRLDLWHSANKSRGGLPKPYEQSGPDEIARAEGWGLHKINPAYQDVRRPEDHLHWGLGILSFKEMVFGYRLPSDVDIEIRREGDRTRIRYDTPRGAISTCTLYTEEMRRNGVTAFHIEEPAVKTVKDYAPLSHIFERLQLYPDWGDFEKWRNAVGEDGLAFTMAGRAASPMHHIQKYLIGATDFFFHYRDHQRELRRLAGSLSPFFDQTIDLIARSPAEAVYWGANFDDMITFPAYFAEDIQPWIRKAAEILGARGKWVSCHCDGENRGLMDLIGESGMHVAEAVCPHPMTKVSIGEYYERWCDRLTIFGGIPSILLLEESASDRDFEDFIDDLLRAVAPGRRMIFGIADSVPQGAKFDRIRRLGERIEKEARLPLEAGGFRFPAPVETGPPGAGTELSDGNDPFARIRDCVLSGDHIGIRDLALALLREGADAGDILQRGMLSAMEAIGERFRTGCVFIPEVLLSARAMNEATLALAPFLSQEASRGLGRVSIGTVHGDLHDIGKNILITMLRGVGFTVTDLGVNVAVRDFVAHVRDDRPDILGLSALLTTTMPNMKDVVDGLAAAGLREHVRIIVGGAPVNETFAREIGADGYGRDAGEAVALARRLVSVQDP